MSQKNETLNFKDYKERDESECYSIVSGKDKLKNKNIEKVNSSLPNLEDR